MSKHHRIAGGISASSFPAEVQPRDREHIAQLLALKKTEQALDTAKDIHRRCGNRDSEALLLDAYVARVGSLIERGLERDASDLITLVRERYPAAAQRLRPSSAVLLARRGDLAPLLEPLNNPPVAPEAQAAIAAFLRRDLFDLRALAECAALPAGHPLRVAAAALHHALDAVTRGPVAEEALALPEVSRSSPVSPWKMLIRAIAAYYRRDDEMCEKCLAAVDQDSAPARLVPPLRAMLKQKQNLTASAAALAEQASAGIGSLRAALKRLDSALDRRNPDLIQQEIRGAVTACRAAEPRLLERLKQHISVRAMVAGVKPNKVSAAIGGPSLKDAHFWRLLARAHEEEKGDAMTVAQACGAWEEFRKHAIRERWFPAKGPEVAALYAHMADQLNRLEPNALASVRLTFENLFDCHRQYYQDQPAVLQALMPSRGNISFLSLDLLLERACEADPCRENFERWMSHVLETKPDFCDYVAEQWAAALPRDIAPLLHLMQSAEERNALQKAFGLMERAEAIDRLNPEVRRARLRLLVSITIRHLRGKKPALAAKDLLQIEALPQAQQGDRPAFVAALRYVWCLLQNAPGESAAAYDATVRLMGDASTAHILILHMIAWCGAKSSLLPKPPLPTVPLYAAYGRVCALSDDLGQPLNLLDKTADVMMDELCDPETPPDPRGLAALGEAAMRDRNLPLAYAISGAGIARPGDSRARFLFLRARTLAPWEDERRSACLAAAAELARRRHDSDLLKQIGEWRGGALQWIDVPGQASGAPDSAVIDRVAEREIGEKAFPLTPPEGPADDYNELCDCPDCRAQRNELPLKVPRELAELVEELGPEAVAKMLAPMLGIGGKKKRGRRRQTLDDDDFPF
jgi:hypothetical protein